MVGPMATCHCEPEPRLWVCEFFESLQGEGPYTGVPATFLRLLGCNLRCGFCDTTYSLSRNSGSTSAERSVSSVLAELSAARARHVVITGGEPLLQAEALSLLVEQLPPSFRIEIETNGTLAPPVLLAHSKPSFNVSPKLHNAKLEVLPDLGVLAQFRDTERAFLKLVISSVADLIEADELVATLTWPRDRVMLMPEARSPAELAARSPLVAEAAIARGYRFSTRLHVLLWGGKRGR